MTDSTPAPTENARPARVSTGMMLIRALLVLVVLGQVVWLGREYVHAPPGQVAEARPTPPPPVPSSAPVVAPVAPPPGDDPSASPDAATMSYTEFIAAVVYLEQTPAALSRDQKNAVLEQVRAHQRSELRVADCVTAMASTLNSQQLSFVCGDHPAVGGAPATPPGTDPLVESLIQKLSKRAAQGTPPTANVQPPDYVPDRETLLEGLGALDRSEWPLSSQQCRQVLDRLLKMRGEFAAQYAIEQKLDAILTPPQLKLITQKQDGSRQESILSTLSIFWLERNGGAHP